MCPSPLEPVNASCIVAKWGHFRAREWHQIGDRGLKWPIPGNGWSLFGELWSYGPEKRSIGGDFGLRWEEVAGEAGRPDRSHPVMTASENFFSAI
jgi:hypothetical protein